MNEPSEPSSERTRELVSRRSRASDARAGSATFAVVAGGGTAGTCCRRWRSPRRSSTPATIRPRSTTSARSGASRRAPADDAVPDTFLDVIGLQRELNLPNVRRNAALLPKLAAARRGGAPAAASASVRRRVVGGYASLPAVLARAASTSRSSSSATTAGPVGPALDGADRRRDRRRVPDSPLPRAVVTGAPLRRRILAVDRRPRPRRRARPRAARRPLRRRRDRRLAGFGSAQLGGRDSSPRADDGGLAVRQVVGDRFLAAVPRRGRPRRRAAPGRRLRRPHRAPLRGGRPARRAGRGQHRGRGRRHRHAGDPRAVVGGGRGPPDANVRWLADQGGAVLLPESDLASLGDHIDGCAPIPDARHQLAVCAAAGDQHRGALVDSSRLAAVERRRREGRHARHGRSRLLAWTHRDGRASRPQRLGAPLDLSRPLRLHVVGVGGPGMSAIAIALAEMGHAVSGSDLRDQPVLDRVRRRRCRRPGRPRRRRRRRLRRRHRRRRRSPPPTSSCGRARALGIPALRRAGMLASICAQARSIGVAGTHGKTTTTSMLMLILAEAELAPSFIVGGDVTDAGTGAHWTGGELLVVEADESDGTHLELPLAGTILLNVELDFLEHYGTFDALLDELRPLPRPRSPGPRCCAPTTRCAPTWRPATASITYGLGPAADVRAVDLEVGRRLLPLRRRASPASGSARSTCRCAACTTWSTPPAPSPWRSSSGCRSTTCRAALARFGGVARRFDIRGVDGGATFVDDYGHLPAEIAAVIAAARDSGDGWGRVIAVFQPNRFNRIAEMWQEYADAFVGADVVVITEIYPSGTTPIPGVTGRLIVNAVLDAHPIPGRVAAAPRGRRVVPRRRGRPRRRVHLDGLR